MKYPNIKLLAVGVAFLGLTSCLKGDGMNVDPSKTNNVIELANTGNNEASASSQYPRFNSDLGVLSLGDSAKFNLNVSYSGADAAPEDITVNLALDTAALTTYNTQDGAHYTTPPSAIYKFPSSVVIKKGTKMVQSSVVIVCNSSFNFNASYALAIKIASASTGVISGNFATAIYSFAARNIYDGVYSVTGTYQDLTLGAVATASYPKTINLMTLGATSNGYFDPNLNGGIYGYSFKNNGSGSYYGNFAPVFAFGSDGKVTAVTNYYGQATNSQQRSAVLDPSGVNKFTFVNGKPSKLEVSYFMYQAGAKRLVISEVFTFKNFR